MKRLILSLAALALLLPSLAVAQDLPGTWQGTLQAGRPLRIVIKITSEGDGLRGVMYSIDQGGQGIAVNALSIQAAAVKFTVPAIGASFDGKLAADGRTIAGTFTQGPNPLPLTLERATPDTAWVIPTLPAALRPMAADAHPVFDVATIKPSDPNAPGQGMTVRGRQVVTFNTTVNDLVSFAYNVHARQVIGGPAWFGTDKFNVTGQPDVEGLPNVEQMRGMMQQLLADRLKLKFHREKKEQPVYALMVGSKGPTLTKSAGDPNGLPGLAFRGLGNLRVVNAMMGDFAALMQSSVLDRPVVDQTGLTGRYDFTLTWTPDETQFLSSGVRVPPPSPDSKVPGLFTAIQQQLGLKFEPTRLPVDTIVVDSVARPTEN